MICVGQHGTGDGYEHFVRVHAGDEEWDDENVVKVGDVSKHSAGIEATEYKEHVDQEVDHDCY